jgi:hypothetical protein
VAESTFRGNKGDLPETDAISLQSAQTHRGESRSTVGITASLSQEIDAFDTPELVRDFSADDQAAEGTWYEMCYLPALQGMRWLGVPSRAQGRLVSVQVGSHGDAIRKTLQLSDREPWCLIPMGVLGLPTIDGPKASRRRSAVLGCLARAGATCTVLCPEKPMGLKADQEQAVIVRGVADPAWRAACMQIFQPYGLAEDSEGIVKPMDLRTPPVEPHYINKKGSEVRLRITRHARFRFAHRWCLVDGSRAAPLDLDWAIASQIASASRKTRLGREERRRQSRYGGDTVLLRKGPLTYIVRNGALITVEISHDGLRHLNKSPVA